jgi:haloalkane dehalogenase
LRVAFLDEGPPEAAPVLLMHGEPSWSFLYRSMVKPLVDAGHRVIAPDLVGFGRSDKPSRAEDYTYARHVGWMRQAIVEGLDLSGICLVGQDWGGLIGLRLLAEHADRFARVVVANTGLPTGDGRMSEAFDRWQKFSQTSPAFDIGRIVSSGCVTQLPPAVVAGYDAPFPADEYKAGARIFPSLVPTRPDDPAAEANRQAWKVLERWEKPFLTAFSDQDPITGGGEQIFQRTVPGARGQQHVTISGAGHFLQEDRGAELAGVVADFIARTSGAG